MSVLVEAVGGDWLVIRQESGRVELHPFADPAELRSVLQRLLAKAEVTSDSVEPEAAAEKVNGKLTKAQIPACQECGACCTPPSSSVRHYVGLEDLDIRRLPVVPGMLVQSGNGFHLATKKNVSGVRTCVALEGEVGERCSCAIYEQRPDACRDFKPGSLGCLEALSRVGVGVTV